ncbi:hypothetical protein [Thermocatellispora tengchongensis]|uniref:hypothetical protein n=1 Tax=Thermocatellispora tengchongensis TaxID=1073253 RepID=UPI0036423FF1
MTVGGPSTTVTEMSSRPNADRSGVPGVVLTSRPPARSARAASISACPRSAALTIASTPSGGRRRVSAVTSQAR